MAPIQTLSRVHRLGKHCSAADIHTVVERARRAQLLHPKGFAFCSSQPVEGRNDQNDDGCKIFSLFDVEKSSEFDYHFLIYEEDDEAEEEDNVNIREVFDVPETDAEESDEDFCNFENVTYE